MKLVVLESTIEHLATSFHLGSITPCRWECIKASINGDVLQRFASKGTGDTLHAQMPMIVIQKKGGRFFFGALLARKSSQAHNREPCRELL